ncbi:NfeD family protein [Ruminococcus sp. OA3]|uniref:NfeD family protein n=1 Tax=Ruminococcus sp. OA3 TaxID=2914164 RepID=UPI001F06793D|nr:NfeD family protein [Ruminococcus sp. OA3]MCH1981681.1 NfeD family protein [Ruminococcus sp. OA3]
MDPIVWLILLVVLIIIEIITMGLSTIWFAGGALVAFVASLLNVNVVIQVVLFLVISILLLVSTRPVAMRYLNRTRVRTNVESLIGKKAVVTERIENIQGHGQVQVNGLEWTARSLNDDIVIEKDEIVCIVRVDGVKLIVEREGEN